MSCDLQRKANGRWECRDHKMTFHMLGPDVEYQCPAGRQEEWEQIKSSPNTPEPPPQPSDHPAAWDLVKADIDERDKVGEAKYGVRLHPFDGRRTEVDAYQEALDLTVYLRKLVYEVGVLRKENDELDQLKADNELMRNALVQIARCDGPQPYPAEYRQHVAALALRRLDKGDGEE